jgi:signal transduction histidine kinase
MRGWPASTRERLTLWYSGALALILVAFAGASLYLFERLLTARTDLLLEQAADLFMNELTVEQAELRSPSAAIAATLREVQLRTVAITIVDPRGRVVARSGLAGPLSEPPRAPGGDRTDRLRTIDDPGGGMRGLTREVRLGDTSFAVHFLQSRHDQRETTEELLLAYLVAIPVFLVAAGAGGWLLTHRALAPVAAMSRRAREIGASNLHERLPVPQPVDEVGSLAMVVNELLARLERSFALQRQFVADASHELRTAVAIVRAESDIALGRASRTEGEYRQALEVTGDAGRRLTRIVDDLLLLARADGGRPVLRTEALYLNELVLDVVRSMGTLAAERGIRLAADGLPDAPVRGDRELLFRMVLNLVDNAVKHGRPGTAVEVSLTVTDAGWRVAVRDEGPGIPADMHATVFERFHRVDPARPRAPGSATSGAGLGLAIARSVAELHGGRLELVHSTPAGSEFAALLPNDPPTPAIQ